MDRGPQFAAPLIRSSYLKVPYHQPHFLVRLTKGYHKVAIFCKGCKLAFGFLQDPSQNFSSSDWHARVEDFKVEEREMSPKTVLMCSQPEKIARANKGRPEHPGKPGKVPGPA